MLSNAIISSSGIFLLDKPPGISSAKAIDQAKKQFHWKKVGHGGTLDPFASGLLVVMVGEATKVARFLLHGEKEYLATATLGTQTNTDDCEGVVVAEKPIPALSREQWQNIANSFLGRKSQVPPIYSALKVDGKPAYAYARRGETIELEPREIYIRELDVTEVLPNTISFRVVCSGGTYVRVLGRDLAAAAQTTAHLSSLRRTKAGVFSIEEAVPLTPAGQVKSTQPELIPFVRALAHLPTVECNDAQVAKIRHGNLAVFQELRPMLVKPGYFLLLRNSAPIAIGNHNPQLNPFCSLERVFDHSDPTT